MQHYISPIPGKVLNEHGKIIGTHEGAFFYTIGQRHGFIIHEKTPFDTPYYIIAKNTDQNTLTVSQKFSEDALKTVYSIVLKDINWIGEAPKPEQKYYARIRYRQHAQESMILENTITFTSPQQGVSRGQSVVVYHNEMCLGGGIIDAVNE